MAPTVEASASHPPAAPGLGKDGEHGTGRAAVKKSFTPRPNFSKIHAKSLPVEVHPLPAFVPHNPISLLRIAYVLVSHFAFPPSSHPKDAYRATFSPDMTSIIVTDRKAIRALWESGFFGKGSLSRSEPNWLAQERKRRGLDGGLTSEMYTQQRRQERIDMKNERARLQREAVEAQLKAETEGATATIGAVSVTSHQAEAPSSDNMFPNFSGAWDPTTSDSNKEPSQAAGRVPHEEVKSSLSPTINSDPEAEDRKAQESQSDEVEVQIRDEEHLQLSLEEAFFLVYALGILQIDTGTEKPTAKATQLLQLFRQHSYFPPKPLQALRPDDPFLIHYVVYHHFRSLGWVIRPGNKFAVDYLLYKGGPVFSHAEFAVVVIPSYVDEWWTGTPERWAVVRSKRAEHQWWWVQNMNRVQTQVLKTLVLVYVEVPPPGRIDVLAESGDIGGVLRQYEIREFIVKRWTPNRQRE